MPGQNLPSGHPPSNPARKTQVLQRLGLGGGNINICLEVQPLPPTMICFTMPNSKGGWYALNKMSCDTYENHFRLGEVIVMADHEIGFLDVLGEFNSEEGRQSHSHRLRPRRTMHLSLTM